MTTRKRERAVAGFWEEEPSFLSHFIPPLLFCAGELPEKEVCVLVWVLVEILEDLECIKGFLIGL